MAVLTKTSRIDIRLSNTDKNLIEKAASYARQSISTYITSVIVKQAQIDIEENETISLCGKDRELVLSLLEKPSEPNDDLIRLFKDHND